MSSYLRVSVRRRQAMLHQQSNPNLHGLEEPTCISHPSLRPCGPLGCAAGFVPHSGSQASFLFCRNYWNRERTRLIAHGFLMPLPQSDMCHLCSHSVSQSKTFGCAETHAIKKTLSPLLPWGGSKWTAVRVSSKQWHLTASQFQRWSYQKQRS